MPNIKGIQQATGLLAGSPQHGQVCLHSFSMDWATYDLDIQDNTCGKLSRGRRGCPDWMAMHGPQGLPSSIPNGLASFLFYQQSSPPAAFLKAAGMDTTVKFPISSCKETYYSVTGIIIQKFKNPVLNQLIECKPML